jgi:chromosome segregation ATPase
MKSMALKLTKDDLKQIGEYLEEKYPLIKGSGRGKSYSRDFEIDIRERIVRVEEELKNQREILNLMLAQMDKRFEMSEKRFEQVEKRFEQVDKRFEQVDKRFEQVDKRFEELRDDMNRGFKMMMWFTGLGFTFVTTFITGIFIYLK